MSNASIRRLIGGLGTALMKELIAAAIGHGVSQIELAHVPAAPP